MRTTTAILAAGSMFLLAAAGGAAAATPAEIQKGFEVEARGAPGFSGFSSQRGEQFFNSRHGKEWTCASCHTANPLAAGKHATTGKDITALAPQANARRFSDPAKVEKWFRRNCTDVLGRACTAQEKGDVMAYLAALGK